MESILLSLVSSYLKDYVRNFRREQVSMNFLRGQGVIKDLDINVDAINDSIFQSGAPGLRFTRIMINTLSIDAPFMSLKSKPIIVHIDELFVEIGEIVNIVQKPKSAPVKPSASPKYGFVDRVIDSMSFQINRVFVALRTLGRLKTTEVGNWTPPVLVLEMTGSRFATTNQSGVETELEECFRVRHTKRAMLFVYKKFSCKKVSAHIINPEAWKSVADDLASGGQLKNIFSKLNKLVIPNSRGYITSNIIRNLSLAINIAMRKRLDNNMLLGIEIAFVFDNAHICFNQKTFKELIHLCIGVSYALSRKDVILEIYGPNPHDERYAASNDQFMKSKYLSSKGTNEALGKEELASLAKLDAEFISTAPVSSTVIDEDWQRSTLGSDEDPRHYRLALSWEITEGLFTLSFDGSSNTESGANARSKKMYGSVFRGVNIQVLGLVYSTIWPEHAAGTEGIQQFTFKSFSINEFVGVRKTCLFRTTNPLDDKGAPICVEIIPRGVKELHQYDSEFQPGVSFVYHRETDFPPPPISKRVASRLEVVVGNLEIICNLDAWYWFLNFIVESWDERWINGDWGTSGRLEDMLGSGSSETTIICNSIQVVVYPDFIRQSNVQSTSLQSTEISNRKDDILSRSHSNTILPSQIIIDIGFLSLIWRSSLNFNILTEMKSMKKSILGSQFPSKATDVSSLLNDVRPIDGIDLLSDRFEASVSQVSVKVVTDTTNSNVDHSNIASAPTRTVVHPFGFVFSTSVDPHPYKQPIFPPKESFLSPYTRIYYWALNSSTISSTSIVCEDVKIECSAIDITRLSHIVQLVHNWVSSVTSPSSQEINNETSTFEGASVQGYPATIILFRLSNLNIQLLKDDDTIKKVRDGKVLSDADVILGIQVDSLDATIEWSESNAPISWTSDNVIVKGQLGGLAVLASNRPVLIVANDDISQVIRLAGGITGLWQSKTSKFEPVLVARYQASASDLNDILQSLQTVYDVSSDGLMINQSSKDLGKNLNIISDAKFIISPDTKIIISLQNIDEALQSFLSELLSGAGVIFSNSEDWLDSSILGYIMRIYREIASEAVNSNDVAVVIKKATEAEKNAAKSRPMALSISFDNSDIILLDIDTAHTEEYVGFGGHFVEASIQGKLQLPSEPLGLILDWKSSLQLYLFSGNTGKALARQYFTNIFPLSCHAHKFDADPLMMKTSLILQDVLSSVNQESNDIANRLIRENLQAIGKGIALLSSDKKGIVHYIQNSWSEISRGVAATALGSNKAKEQARLQMESLLGLTMHLLENSKSTRRRQLNEGSSENDLTEESFESTEKHLVNNLRSEIQSNYLRLQSFAENYNKFPAEILSAVEDIDRAVKSLDTCLNKLQHFAVLSSNQTPSCCGWLRKSHSFSRADRSTHGSRFWCLLIRDSLFFMTQPYAKKVEYEVCIDRSYAVIDPDDDDASTNSGKNSLTSLLWISNPEKGSINEGVLVLDCLSLDEKCMWLEALKSWIPSNTAAAKRLAKTRSRLSFGFGSSSSSSVTEDGIDVPTKHDPILKPSSSTSTSRFRSATKGMFRAISLSRKSIPDTKSITSPSAHQSTNQPYIHEADRESLSSNENSSTGDSLSQPITSDMLHSSYSNVIQAHSNSNSSILDLLNELDDLRIPLEQYASLMESMKLSYVHKFQETSNMIDSMRNSFLALFLGLSILHTIEDENDRAVRDEVNESKIRINQLVKELHDEKAKNHTLLENWAKSRQLQRESESVLQAITMQHISTVLNMSKQYDDLMDQYQMTKMGAQDAAYFALSNTSYSRKEPDPVTPHDLIRQLARALQETETLMKQSMEKEAMMAQEVDSIVVETDFTRQENADLVEAIANLRSESIESAKKFEAELEAEKQKNRELERERDLYKDRYQSLLEVLKTLGHDTSLSTSTS